ncbi:MAG: rhomboid family intramembrane serine protease [Burkholderiaceae bacterium]|nr:MAG: rhomboid family intramembrane serine protease [Burkholderiaceae bacterium]
MASAVGILIFINVIAYLLELSAGGGFVRAFALWPLQAGFMPWQVITYAFLHGNLMHLAFNMFGLWMFGRELEALLLRQTFFLLYFASVLTASIAQLAFTLVSGSGEPTVGASGGVFGLLLAYAMFFPNRVLVLLFPPIPLPAWLFVTLYAGLELMLGVTGTQAGVAHFAHLGGMVGAYFVIQRWRRRR